MTLGLRHLFLGAYNQTRAIKHMNSRRMTSLSPWIILALAILPSSCNSSLSPTQVQPHLVSTQFLAIPTEPLPNPRTFSLPSHAWAVVDVALSASGHLALSVDRGGFLRLWDVETGDLLRVWVQKPGGGNVSLSADGRVALSSNYKGIRIWDTSTGKLLQAFGHDKKGSSVYTKPALSADGRFVLSVGGDHIARLWDAGTGKLLRTFRRLWNRHQHNIKHISLSSDGRFALSGTGYTDDTVLFWDTTTGNILHTFVHDTKPRHLASIKTSISADGRYALSSIGSDSIARLWDLNTGEQLRAFDHDRHAANLPATADHSNTVRHIALNADGSLAISVAVDGLLRLWSRSSDAPLRTFNPRGIVNAIALSAQGGIAMTGGDTLYADSINEGIAHIWDMTRDDPKRQVNIADASPSLRIEHTITHLSTDSGHYAKEVRLTSSLSPEEDEAIRYRWELYDRNKNLIGSQEGKAWGIKLAESGYYTVRLTATSDSGTFLAREETLHLPATKRPIAVMSGLPESGHAPIYVDLDGSASSDEDGEIVRFYWQTNSVFGTTTDEQDSWRGLLRPGIHEVSLTVVDDHGARNTAKKTIYLEPDPDYYDIKVYNDNVIVFSRDPQDAAFFNSRYGLALFPDYFWVIHTYFEDAFDYLLFFSNSDEVSRGFYDLGFFNPIRDIAKGLGTRLTSKYRYRLSKPGERLQSILHLPHWFALEDGSVLHEIMHTWGNYMIPTNYPGHFGFSTANARTGGFDARHLQRRPEFDQEDGEAWVVPGSDSWDIMLGRQKGGPYSPIELYMAGLIPISEVPTLRTAPNAYRLNTLNTKGIGGFDKDMLVLDEDGNTVWIVPGWEEYTPARILEEFGPRIPPFGEARTEFRAAAILLTDEDHPATEERLKALSAQVAAFSRKGDDGADTTNFYEATGGRATITMDGLTALKKPEPALPRVDDSGP